MAELAALALLTAVGMWKIRNPDTDDPAPVETFDDTQLHWENTVPLPRVEGIRAEPHSIPWDEVNHGTPLPQENRSILMNRPLIWRAKSEVPAEEPKVQRDPLYPDDMRSYDVQRSRMQQVLMDSHNRNYQFGGYHIPFLAQNKTRQEVSQSQHLAGRTFNAYTTGGQENNGPIRNLKEPTNQVVRRTVEHIVDDRSTYQPWAKRQHAELVNRIQQEAVPQVAVVHQPNQHIHVTKTRDTPKYLNYADTQDPFITSATAELSAKDNRGHIEHIDTLYKKKLLLLGDEGFATSKVTFYGGHAIDNNALRYPFTGRTREILPEVSTSGLVGIGGTGRSFIDANRGIGDTNKTQLRNRPVNGAPKLFAERVMARDATQWSTFHHDPISDRRARPPKGTWDHWHAKAEPMWATEHAHGIDTPLMR